MNRLLRLFSFHFLLACSFFLSTCGSDDGGPQVITQVILNFTPVQGEGTETLSFKYRGDAIDQNVLEKADLVLSRSTFYTVDVLMQSEIGISPIDLSGQIRTESDEWQIFYLVQSEGSTIATWSYRDMDINGLPIGLETQAITQSAGNGTMTLTVKEQRPQSDGTPTKASGFGIEAGASAPGETKIEITFNIITQ